MWLFDIRLKVDAGVEESVIYQYVELVGEQKALSSLGCVLLNVIEAVKLTRLG